MQSEAQVREYAKENNLTVVDNRNIVELRKVFKKSIADYEEYTKVIQYHSICGSEVIAFVDKRP